MGFRPKDNTEPTLFYIFSKTMKGDAKKFVRTEDDPSWLRLLLLSKKRCSKLDKKDDERTLL